jgi:hypothetical protein
LLLPLIKKRRGENSPALHENLNFTNLLTHLIHARIVAYGMVYPSFLVADVPAFKMIVPAICHCYPPFAAYSSFVFAQVIGLHAGYPVMAHGPGYSAFLVMLYMVNNRCACLCLCH